MIHFIYDVTMTIVAVVAVTTAVVAHHKHQDSVYVLKNVIHHLIDKVEAKL